MAKISGCYRWNDTLAASGGAFLLDLPLRVNGTSYVGTMINADTEDETMVALFEENETMTIVYVFGAGWIRAISLQDENPTLAQNDLWQTWDFGEEQEIPDHFYEYLMANASPVASADAVNLSYGGRIIASVDGGQSATLHCRGKSMNSDLLLLVPRRRSASGGGAEMNVAFGNTAPDDTSKLWIKTEKPESVEARLSFDFVGNEQMQAATLALPAHVYHSSACAVGKKIYIFGGGGSSYSAAIYVYDTETNGMEKLTAVLPTAAAGNASAAVGKKIYIFGGRSGSGSTGKSKKIRVFDTETHAVDSLAVELPEDRYQATAAAVGNKIYIFGGSYYSSGEKARSTIYLFNAESNAITSLAASLPSIVYYACAVAVGSKIYVFGGYDGTNPQSTISVFDTAAQTVETLDVTLPTPAYMFSGAAVGSVIYLFGGYNGGGLDTIVRFNTETHEIETLGATMSKKNWGTPAASVGSKIYVFDGHSSASDCTLNTFHVHIDLPENHMLIETSGAGNTVRLFPNMEVGVKNVYLGNAEGKGERVPAALYKDGAWTEI